MMQSKELCFLGVVCISRQSDHKPGLGREMCQSDHKPGLGREMRRLRTERIRKPGGQGLNQ